jgi:hypothetical protein
MMTYKVSMNYFLTNVFAFLSAEKFLENRGFSYRFKEKQW